ncbi:MAG: zinc-ribbon domain-containing protein [Lachnospiraceae bacterium]|nr:zinc-ribbon domain-containing protein [Lachnospiraceae bacterium]
MICPKCNANNPEGSRFCMTCGTLLSNDASQAPTNQAPQSDAPTSAPTDAPASDAPTSAPANDATQAPTNQAPQNSAPTSAPTGAPQPTPTQAPNNTPNDAPNNAPNSAPKYNFGNNQPNGAGNAAPGSSFNNSSAAPGAAPGSNPNPALAKPAIEPAKIAIIAGIAFAALVLIAVVIFLIVNRKTKIDLNDYYTVTFEGYDSYGKAKVNVKDTKLLKDTAKAAGVDYRDLESYFENEIGALFGAGSSKQTKEAKKLRNLFYAYKDLDYHISKEENLKNGDKVTITYKFDNEAAKKAKIKFVGKSKTFEVKGLKEAKEYNPFDHITVSFDGMSPNASLNLEKDTDENINSFTFEYDKSYGLKLGDKVKITANCYYSDGSKSVEEYFAKQGLKVTELEKEYTVENVDAYVTDPADLDDKILNNMKSGARDAISSYFASYKSYIKRGGYKYEGYYFLSSKNSSSWYNNNIIYIIYSCTVKSKDKDFKPTKVYFPVQFSNAIKYKDGTVGMEDLSADQYDIKGSSGPSYGWFSKVKGYKKTGLMKNELLTTQKSNYNVFNKM